MTQDISQACCLSERVFEDQVGQKCPDGWHPDPHDEYCTSKRNFGPNELRFKCVRNCPGQQ